MSTRLSVNKDGNKRHRNERSLMDWQWGQSDDDDLPAESFSDLITRATGVHAQKYLALTTTPASQSASMQRPGEPTVIALGAQQSNYDKTLHKIDQILKLEQSEGDAIIDDDISDYEYEDESEDEPKQETTERPAPKTRQQFSKSLNGDLRKAGKMLAKPQRKFPLAETGDTIDGNAVEPDTEASSVASVIDDYNQTDSTISVSVEGSALTTTSESDNDDVVEIDTTEKNGRMSSTVSIIENDFQINQNTEAATKAEAESESEVEVKDEAEAKQKPAANDNNNERDLLDNNEEHNNKGRLPPQSINQTVSDLMLSDAALLDNDDIDIVKLDETPASHEANLYKTAVEQAKSSPHHAPPASENEVLKDQDSALPAHLTPLKPYVSERIDRPSKRILVNLTIATEGDSASVYTLHVEVPTGDGPHNVEQVLTQEKIAEDENNNIDNGGACVFEPPPRMPDCPCSCLPPEPLIFADNDNSPVDIDSAVPTTAAPHAEEATILSHQHDESDNEQVESLTDSTFTNLPTTDTNNNIAASDTSSDVLGGEKNACPDVMPILILEGDCTICYRC